LTADRRETLSRDRNLSALYNASPKFGLLRRKKIGEGQMRNFKRFMEIHKYANISVTTREILD